MNKDGSGHEKDAMRRRKKKKKRRKKKRKRKEDKREWEKMEELKLGVCLEWELVRQSSELGSMILD